MVIIKLVSPSFWEQAAAFTKGTSWMSTQPMMVWTVLPNTPIPMEHPCSAEASMPGSPVFTGYCSRTHTEETGFQTSARTHFFSVPMVTMDHPRRALCFQNSRNDPRSRWALWETLASQGQSSRMQWLSGHRPGNSHQWVCSWLVSWEQSGGQRDCRCWTTAGESNLHPCHCLCYPQGHTGSNSFDSPGRHMMACHCSKYFCSTVTIPKNKGLEDSHLHINKSWASVYNKSLSLFIKVLQVILVFFWNSYCW